MSGRILADIVGVQTEHLLSEHREVGLVKLRVTLEDGSVALGQLEPWMARQIADHLHESAARAEYEEDAWRSLSDAGMDTETKGLILNAIRAGEFHRHTKGREA